MKRDHAVEAQFHRDRAKQFRAHAASTKNAEARERYLHLAEGEEALAKRIERSIKKSPAP
ncbi:MAG TPA: hypothetical protein VFA23_00185 [Dongiaceae bacterium]|nr:hypothetical protein [Dongiaceae bacterium]